MDVSVDGWLDGWVDGWMDNWEERTFRNNSRILSTEPCVVAMSSIMENGDTSY